VLYGRRQHVFVASHDLHLWCASDPKRTSKCSRSRMCGPWNSLVVVRGALYWLTLPDRSGIGKVDQARPGLGLNSSAKEFDEKGALGNQRASMRRAD
jgi:hypothetical protein